MKLQFAHVFEYHCNQFDIFHMNNLYSRNKTLYGLRTNHSISVKYNIHKQIIEDIEGLDSNDISIEISDNFMFNVPEYVVLDGVPFFPSKYESFNQEYIYYCATRPPNFNIKVEGVNDFYGYTLKTRAKVITKKKLEQYDRRRSRTPTQAKVMGESAAVHVQKLINTGHIVIHSQYPIQWHWCHLIAFSMQPTEKSQTSKNLVCGTSACNGQMANIESAVKLFVYEHDIPLRLEVSAEVIAETHVATRIRYRVFESKRGMLLFSEYFDPLTDLLADYKELKSVYDSLLAKSEL